MKRNLIAILLIMLSFFLYSQENKLEKPTIAMLKFKAVGMDEVTVNGIEENLLNQLIKQKKFVVVERSQLNRVLEELNLTSTEDFSDEKAVEIGNLLGAESIIIGSVTKLGNSITINVRGIDVKTGIAVFAEDKTTNSEKQLVKIIKELATLIGNTTKDEKNVAVNDKTIKENKIKKYNFKNLNTDLKPKIKLTPLNISGIALVSVGAAFSIAGTVLTIYDNAYYGSYVQGLKDQGQPSSVVNPLVDIDTALFSSGITSLAIGIGVVAASIPMMIYQKKNQNVSFYIENGRELKVGFSYKF